MVLGAGLRGGICISLEKELASLGHLFLAKNPDTTPRRADHGGFAKREERKSEWKVDLDIPELHVDRGVGVFFLARKKMSEQSEFFFQKKKYPQPPYPPATPSGYIRM
jgi:hypothetical protein